MGADGFAGDGANAYSATGHGTSVAAGLAALAAAAPDAPAVTCGDTTITRAELLAATRRLAARLAAGGVGQGDLVTIGLPNGVEFYVAVVAAWTLGAVPQPVSARLPAAELAGLLELADPPVVIGLAPPTAGPGSRPASWPRPPRPPRPVRRCRTRRSRRPGRRPPPAAARGDRRSSWPAGRAPSR